MKISLDWLNTHLDRPVTADEAAKLLAEQGFPIESSEPLPGGDHLIDAEVTSNRGDCLSHVGMAREVAAGSGRSLVLPNVSPPAKRGEPVGQLLKITVEDENLCPLYTAHVVRGVKVGPSPDWLVTRLSAIGLRSINNIVDITNFILHDTGQPLHAFDLAKLNGPAIVVRSARKGETLTAIDGSKHALHTDRLVIADAQRPVAIAGVMGGLESEVGPGTTDVLIESAVFDPLSVRTTARALKLHSDSSYRFERGLDITRVEGRGLMAATMMVDLAGGTLGEGSIVVGQALRKPRHVTLRLSRCRSLLGIDIEPMRVVELLVRLGLETVLTDRQGERVFECVVPSHRLDLEREVDLIEEVARMHGLHNIPINEKIHIVARSLQPHVAARRKLGQVLVAHGYHEAVTFSFVNEKQGADFTPPDAHPVQIDDARRKAEPVLRPSVLPSLLNCRKSNQDVGNHGVKLFETASTWVGREKEIIETRRLALVCDAPTPEMLRDLRGTLEELCTAMHGGGSVTFVETQVANMSAATDVRLLDRSIGYMGLLDDKTQKAFDLQTPVAAAELELEPLLAGYPPVRRVGHIPRYPAIERDLSVVVGDEVRWERIAFLIQQTQPDKLESLAFVGVYRGKQVGKGRKSVTLRMTFRDPAGTLRHDQVDGQVTAVVNALRSELGAELRQ